MISPSTDRSPRSSSTRPLKVWVCNRNKPTEKQRPVQGTPYNDERFYSQVDSATGFVTRSILCAPLQVKGETIGAVLRTRNSVSPVFVSIGHRVSLETAIDYVLRCTTRYRLPETTRWAHRLASGHD